MIIRSLTGQLVRVDRASVELASDGEPAMFTATEYADGTVLVELEYLDPRPPFLGVYASLETALQNWPLQYVQEDIHVGSATCLI